MNLSPLPRKHVQNHLVLVRRIRILYLLGISGLQREPRVVFWNGSVSNPPILEIRHVSWDGSKEFYAVWPKKTSAFAISINLSSASQFLETERVIASSRLCPASRPQL